jgi:hypothetical protein
MKAPPADLLFFPLRCGAPGVPPAVSVARQAPSSARERPQGVGYPLLDPPIGDPRGV